MVSDGKGGDAVAQFGHHTGTLVAHHQGRRGVPLAALDMQIGVTHAGGGDPDANLAGLGPVEIDFGELDGGSGITEHDGFHKALLERSERHES